MNFLVDFIKYYRFCGVYVHLLYYFPRVVKYIPQLLENNQNNLQLSANNLQKTVNLKITAKYGQTPI